MKVFRYSWLLLLLLQSKYSFGQACGETPAGVMISTVHPKGTWMFSYTYMNTMMENNLVGTNKVDDPFIYNHYIMSPQNMRMDMQMLMVMYGVSDKLNVMLMSNYNILTMNMNMMQGMTINMNGSAMSNSDSTTSSLTSGLGDTKLYALYSLLNRNGHFLIASGGFSIPTGSINKKGRSDNTMYPGTRLPYVMQLGSGTFDFMPGVTYVMKKNKITCSAQVLSVIRPFYNSIGYHFGNELTFNVWTAYQWFPWMSSSMRFESYTSGTIKGNDPQVYAVMEPDANPMCYGGYRLSGYAGINFFITKGRLRNNKFSVEYGLPFYQNLNGPQQSIHSTLYAVWALVI
ncbi:MAG: transporter [Bacteroidetes bacterium]|nr:transporter [Bacteroidota bacterium]